MPSSSAVRVGSRIAAGLVGLTLAVSAAGAAALIPWPTVTVTPPSAEVEPIPSEQLRVCPGPLLTLAEDSGQAQSATSIGSATAVYGTTYGANAPGEIDDVTPLVAGDNARGARDGGPLLLRVPAPEGATVPSLVAGSQSQTAEGETVGGFAAAACGEAVADAWLVGGSTDIGRTSLVLLSNPTTVVASVDLTVIGETGIVDAPGANGILVQPGSQRIVSLAGLAPNLQSPVVHVEAHGGQVAASLEQSLIQGIEPGGVELLEPAASPSLTQVIAGLVVAAQAPAAAETDADHVPDEIPSVRILAPGEEPAQVEVVVVGAAGPGTPIKVDVQPGIVAEIPLPGLAVGSYAVRLVSDQPIVAAARASAADGAGKDFAWFAASVPFPGDFMVSVAPGPAPTLHLVNTGPGEASVTVTAENGSSDTLPVGPGATASRPLGAGERYVVAGGTSLVASVSYAGPGMLSGFTLTPSGPLAAPIRVYPR
ncbi:DUF5719 family protein [Cryobacterium tagatosivorans]|uniref:Large extracellular alpha-helical protein n=1 Tax=Cryobacterium tagatosivorans TaxID=1259199 RepID=A0A4R8UI96_9MICO|nr:DUF5719 family protein [Cryobacterium tagatosivorans]TFB53922.1 hypothetical protein E3O23_04315 [Cryobacterium tagatosivorans]